MFSAGDYTVVVQAVNDIGAIEVGRESFNVPGESLVLLLSHCINIITLCQTVSTLSHCDMYVCIKEHGLL